MRKHRDWFDPAVEAAEIADYTWHCKRHTFASRLAMVDVNLHTVAQLLGHGTLTMTMRYAHLSPEHNQSAVERLVARPASTDGAHGHPNGHRKSRKAVNH